jgi:hypothetical protein
MYDAKKRLMVNNSINRYKIGVTEFRSTSAMTTNAVAT